MGYHAFVALLTSLVVTEASTVVPVAPPVVLRISTTSGPALPALAVASCTSMDESLPLEAGLKVCAIHAVGLMGETKKENEVCDWSSAALPLLASFTSPGLVVRSTLAPVPDWKSACVVSVKQAWAGAA